MDEPISTPPVIEVDHVWTGEERRKDPTASLARAVEQAVNHAAQTTSPRNMVDSALIKAIAGTVVGFVILIIILLFMIMNKIESDNDDQDKFRNAVTCFIVGTQDETTRADILTKCGFITVPGS